MILGLKLNRKGVDVSIKKNSILIGLIIFLFILIPNVYAKENDEIIKSETKYFKTISDPYGLVEETYEVTEEEYNANKDINLVGPYWNTAYKKLTMGYSSGMIDLTLQWTAVPTYQSYDVLAIRTEGVNLNMQSLTGAQTYLKNGTPGSVGYLYTTQNTKMFNNGVGISMNLVDGATDFSLSMSVIYNITGSYPHIYGSYQHATRNVTLAQSQKYSLSSSGYGKVILFDDSVKGYYDQMGGVDIAMY